MQSILRYIHKDESLDKFATVQHKVGGKTRTRLRLCHSSVRSLEEVDCFKYLVSQVAADRGCQKNVVHRMKNGYRAYGALKSVQSNRGLRIKANKC